MYGTVELYDEFVAALTLLKTLLFLLFKSFLPVLPLLGIALIHRDFLDGNFFLGNVFLLGSRFNYIISLVGVLAFLLEVLALLEIRLRLCKFFIVSGFRGRNRSGFFHFFRSRLGSHGRFCDWGRRGLGLFVAFSTLYDARTLVALGLGFAVVGGFSNFCNRRNGFFYRLFILFLGFFWGFCDRFGLGFRLVVFGFLLLFWLFAFLDVRMVNLMVDDVVNELGSVPVFIIYSHFSCNDFEVVERLLIEFKDVVHINN